MIIRKIKIRNYKTYLSLDLDLMVKADRPIILIGGGNGGGKTTLFEAICGALYGLKIRDKTHFRELVNNGAVGREYPQISLELTFEGMVLNQTKKYILSRTYRLNDQDRPVESVSLNMDGSKFIYGTATPAAKRAESEQQVSKIIKANLPQELSKYFLFDAMQSSDLLKEKVFAQIIQDNIQNVMGFKKYMQLQKAAEAVHEEWTAQRLEAKKEAEEYNSLCVQKRELVKEKEELGRSMDELYRQLNDLSPHYEKAKEGAINAKEVEKEIKILEERMRETREASSRYNEQLKDVVENLEVNVFFPQLASNMQNEINDIIRKKEALTQAMKEVLTVEQLRDVTSKVLAYLKSKLMINENIDEGNIVDYLVSLQEEVSKHDEYAYLDNTEVDALKRLISTSTINNFIFLDQLRLDLEKRLSDYDNQEKQLTVLKESQQKGDTEIISAYETLKTKLDKLNNESTDIAGKIRKLEKEMQGYDLQLQKEPDVRYDTLTLLKPFFEEVTDSLLQRKKSLIEEEMKQQLNVLLTSYKDCIKKVELSDTMDNFSIKLYHKAGNEISLNQLNAASKQIFIQVLLKVLRNLGDYNPPVMIDTVMGVLDEESRDVLLEHYFPTLSEQTILLCTTAEIRQDSDYKKLEPFVSRTYTLIREVEEQKTRVEEGYFGINLSD